MEKNVNNETREILPIEAMLILNPSTREETMAKIPEELREQAENEARIFGCIAIDKQIIVKAENRPLGGWACPVCGKIFYDTCNYCSTCGQPLDFDGHSENVLNNSKIIKPEIILPR